MHSFHNTHLTRAVIPRTLSAPKRIYQDRLAKHTEWAAQLRRTQKTKRTEQKKKREDAKKAQGKQAGPATALHEPEPDSDMETRTVPQPSRKRPRIDAPAPDSDDQHNDAARNFEFIMEEFTG